MFKLCPIEPTDEMTAAYHEKYRERMFTPNITKESLKAAIAECQTVEVIKDENFLFNQMRDIQTDPMIAKRQDLKKIGLTVAQILDAHLIKNGYQIIKVKDENQTRKQA